MCRSLLGVFRKQELVSEAGGEGRTHGILAGAELNVTVRCHTALCRWLGAALFCAQHFPVCPQL